MSHLSCLGGGTYWPLLIWHLASISEWFMGSLGSKIGAGIVTLVSKFHDPDIADVGILSDLIEGLRGRHTIQVEDGQRLAAGLVAAQAHAGNVDLVSAHERADMADHARPIFVVHQEEDAGGNDFHWLTEHADDARVVGRPEERPAGRPLVVAR